LLGVVAWVHSGDAHCVLRAGTEPAAGDNRHSEIRGLVTAVQVFVGEGPQSPGERLPDGMLKRGARVVPVVRCRVPLRRQSQLLVL